MTTLSTSRVIRYDMPQVSPEWFAVRCGCLTASAAKHMLATIKTGEAAARRDMRTRIVCERLTGKVDDDPYTNDDMARGQELEPVARSAYEQLTGSLVEQCGFLKLSDAPVGFSPDGLVDDDGLVEIKAPRTARHLSYLRSGGIPSEHAAQLLHALYVSGRQWIDFVSIDVQLPHGLRLFVARMVRDEGLIADYHAKVTQFLAEVDAEVAEVQKLATATEPAF